ncbi:MAG TPA: HAD hydrolase family protein [Candidatus Dormibacteraeota bacterium]|nr:HAD hydrolase family protein [Candidatus Dormibacteraeota bacterium]
MAKKSNPGKVAPSVTARAKKIRVLLMDVDGVLTDGRIWLLSRRDGTASEIKGFSAYDGAGLKMARNAGLRTGVITGRESTAVAQRARECEIEFVFQKRATKIDALEEILRTAGAGDAEVAYVGDDLPDLPVLRRAGLAIAVANAAPEVKRAAHFVTVRRGGDGAVREVIELILKAQGKWMAAAGNAKA